MNFIYERRTSKKERNQFGNHEVDSQRGKVYKAEREALDPIKKPLADVNAVEKFCAKVFKRASLLKKYKRTEIRLRRRGGAVTVKDGRGRRSACGGWGEISLPRWARSDWVTLHELAHVMNDWENGREPAGHGWQFCAIYLDLVKWFMGKEAHAALKASFKKHRVRTRAKTVRAPLSPEVRQQRIETLAKARLARCAGRAQLPDATPTP